jgi:preprotein translocase subunit SecA
MLRLWERDIMLHCIDSLWTDFLQDISTLQRAAMTRSFSQFDPVDEFKLEAAVVFARLLRDFRRQSPVALLAPVDIRHLQWDTTYNAEQQQQQEEQQQDLAQGDGSGTSNNNFDGVLDDVAWLADTMEVEPTTENVENLEKEQPVPAAPAVSQQSTASFGASSAGEGAAIEKLLARISQASSEELGAAIEKLEEKWKNKEKED